MSFPPITNLSPNLVVWSTNSHRTLASQNCSLPENLWDNQEICFITFLNSSQIISGTFQPSVAESFPSFLSLPSIYAFFQKHNNSPCDPSSSCQILSQDHSGSLMILLIHQSLLSLFSNVHIAGQHFFFYLIVSLIEDVFYVSLKCQEEKKYIVSVLVSYFCCKKLL